MRRLSRPMRLAWLPASLVLAAVVTAAPAATQEAVVIYRCTAADGAVTVQNDEPCPRGSREQRRVLETAPPPSQPYVPPPRPAPEPPAATPALMPMPAEPAPADSDTPLEPVATDIEPELRPPPPLFACTTWQREDYLTDSEVPAERCAAMRTTGLDGSASGGAGAACMVVVDACQPVPEAELCTRWQQLLQASEATVQFGRGDDPAAARAELERVRAIVERNRCDG
ncbi:hypothetical protein N799_11800 [Lysobacter arseniciresistens ZS79]|uniref:DUF4124 domain-containing protein n=1 Tax=Lysobacter arseniciresistens ZS79 TaxID=913325 RepID=A0A0A0ER54_9GAMM|nr:hypothetical protein [Lysobacter arseniciresistens]KGM53441.1 hypothetical protein N799_11800 [Lysobacter arseniciresistens ZS79]